MLKKLKEYPRYFEFYDKDELPNHKECYLLGEDNEKIIVQQWLNYILPESDMQEWEHPNGLMEHIPCHISSASTSHFNLTLLLDRSRRFHTVTRTLPKKFFKIAFLPFTSESRPYIIVDQQWFNQIQQNIYSSYVMIDFIGIGSLLNEHGEFPLDKIITIKAIIDKYSIQNPGMQFLSCADNIIIKTAWNLRSADNAYAPEKLIYTVNKIMGEIKQEAMLSSYAVFTQGANYVNEMEIPSGVTPINHLFLSSISAPFMECFAIDEHVRSLIRAKKMIGHSFYLEKSFYISSERKFSSGNEPQYFQEKDFEHKKTGKVITFSPLNFQQICDLIKIEP